MSKYEKVDKIKKVLRDNKLKHHLNVFCKGKLYKQLPFEIDVNISVSDKDSADNFIRFLEKLRNDASENPRITGFNIYPDLP